MIPFFVPDKDGLEELAEEADFSDLAEEIAAEARAIAPVEEGDYRDSIEVVSADGEEYVVAKDWKAWWIEYGTVDTQTFATLRTAAKNRGLDVTEAGRGEISAD
jgi:hypothetical protein